MVVAELSSPMTRTSLNGQSMYHYRKSPTSYKYFHAELGYNYRLPNLNATLACAQLESIENFICNRGNWPIDIAIFLMAEVLTSLKSDLARHPIIGSMQLYCPAKRAR